MLKYTFLIFFFFYYLLRHLNYLPIRAGAIKDKVDIFTAPNNDTKRSNQGTVAANPTVNIIIILKDPTRVLESSEHEYSYYKYY